MKWIGNEGYFEISQYFFFIFRFYRLKINQVSLWSSAFDGWRFDNEFSFINLLLRNYRTIKRKIRARSFLQQLKCRDSVKLREHGCWNKTHTWIWADWFITIVDCTHFINPNYGYQSKVRLSGCIDRTSILFQVIQASCDSVFTNSTSVFHLHFVFTAVSIY